jgi:hypothetical protein
MVSFAKLQIIRQGIRKKYKNIGLEKFLLSIDSKVLRTNYFWGLMLGQLKVIDVFRM